MNALSSKLQLLAMIPTTPRHFSEGRHRTRRLVHGRPSVVPKKVWFLAETMRWQSLLIQRIDYKLLIELLPPGSAELTQTRKALLSLEPRTRAAQEKETAEMMDKLKGLGNTILGTLLFREIKV